MEPITPGLAGRHPHLQSPTMTDDLNRKTELKKMELCDSCAGIQRNWRKAPGHPELVQGANRQASGAPTSGTRRHSGQDDDGSRGRASSGTPAPGAGARGQASSSPDRRDPVARLEAQTLEVALQLAHLVPPEFDALSADTYAVPAFRAVHEAIRAAGGMAVARGLVEGQGGAGAWVEKVSEEAAAPVRSLVTELAVTPLPEDRPDSLETYVRGVISALIDLGLTREIADARGRLQRMDPDREPEAYQAAFEALIASESRRRALRADG